MPNVILPNGNFVPVSGPERGLASDAMLKVIAALRQEPDSSTLPCAGCGTHARGPRYYAAGHTRYCVPCWTTDTRS